MILPVFNIALPIASVAGVGGGSLISRLLGNKRGDEAQKIFSFSVYMSIVAALVYSLTIFAFMSPILLLLGAGSETFEYARQYAMCVIVFGGLPTILSNVIFCVYFIVIITKMRDNITLRLVHPKLSFQSHDIPMLFILNKVLGMYGLVWSQLAPAIFVI